MQSIALLLGCDTLYQKGNDYDMWTTVLEKQDVILPV